MATQFMLNRRRCLQFGAAAAATCALPAHLRAASAEGPGGYETLDLDWTDEARQRPVPVRLYVPQSAAASRPARLIVFSHGIGGSRRGYSWLGQYVASHGMASLHLQHVGSDRQVWTGNVFNVVSRLQDAAKASEAIDRACDLRFALDSLLASPLAERLDAAGIVAAGHSYGANTTLLASGARIARPGLKVPLHDPRVRAAVVISAPPFYGQGEPSSILSGINIPSLHVTATEDVIRIPGYYSGAEDRLAVFNATGGPRKWLAVYEGGSHSMFTDRSGTGGALLNPQVKTATQALVMAFVRSVFDGDDSQITAWPQQHAAIVSRFDRVVRG